MQVRGAPLIGVAAAYGVCLALRADASDAALESAPAQLLAARPTAVNLRWALAEMQAGLLARLPPARGSRGLPARAARMATTRPPRRAPSASTGCASSTQRWRRKDRRGPVNVLTHCNAGLARDRRLGHGAGAGLPRARRAASRVHVWVDETRPRNQGAALTAWELAQAQGAAHGDRRQRRRPPDAARAGRPRASSGTDRTTRRGDVCNKIGTYLKALAARDNGVPVLRRGAALDIDWTLDDGVARDPDRGARPARGDAASPGALADGAIATVQLDARGQPGAATPASTSRPARLVTGIITERGVCAASEEGLRRSFPSSGVHVRLPRPAR